MPFRTYFSVVELMSYISKSYAFASFAFALLAGSFAHASEYVGFGAVTRGAADCPSGQPQTYHVTHLNNSGEGSLRDAVSEDCRHVVFDVAGTIDITGTLQISNSYITIDGSQAPAPGITLSVPGQRIALEARSGRAVHDIIVNNIRTVGQGGDIETKDHWELDGSSGAPVYNVIFDHLTMVASSDGSVDIYGDVHHVTLSNSLLRDSVKSQHYSNSGGVRDAITIFRNVYARNNERQPKIRYNTTRVEFVNNVIYGWGWMEGGASGMRLQVGGSSYSPSGNIENNIAHYVSGLHGRPDQALLVDSPLYGDWYFSGNRWPAEERDAVSTSGKIDIPQSARVIGIPVGQLADSVVPCAGTNYPTAEEIALLEEISLAIGGSAPVCNSSATVPKPPSQLGAE